jgi:hypothetical protein
MDEVPSTSLTSALALYDMRKGSDLLEGIRLHDNNYPLDPDSTRHDIIVVSDNEFYSVLATDIVDSDPAAEGHPQRMWIREGADVWRCQKMKLDVSGQEAVKHRELPSAIDQHLSTNFALTHLTEAPAIVPPRSPAIHCGTVSQHRVLTPSNIKQYVLLALRWPIPVNKTPDDLP